jgi:uncharacterized protein (DUF486 family)
MWQTFSLLVLSNLFMTFAWYGHLKHLRGQPLFIAILVSWGIALAEYCFQVPANRIGINSFSLPQLKVMQEIITMVVFAAFAMFYMGVPITRNLLWAGLCLAGSAYFIFKDGLPVR